MRPGSGRGGEGAESLIYMSLSARSKLSTVIGTAYQHAAAKLGHIRGGLSSLTPAELAFRRLLVRDLTDDVPVPDDIVEFSSCRYSEQPLMKRVMPSVRVWVAIAALAIAAAFLLAYRSILQNQVSIAAVQHTQQTLSALTALQGAISDRDLRVR